MRRGPAFKPFASRGRWTIAVILATFAAVSALTPGRADDEPLRLASLAERGELEYASDVVLLLGPRSSVGLASAARAQASPGVSMLDLLVAKNRYGESGRTLPLLFRASIGEFQEEPSI